LAVTVAPPDTPVAHLAVIIGDQSLGTFSDPQLDLSTSIDSGGRDWTAVIWNVNNNGNNNLARSSEDLEDLREYLNDQEADLVVPRALPHNRTTYAFTVHLCNFLGYSTTSGPFEVTAAAKPAPDMVITTGAPYRMFLADDLSISAEAPGACKVL
jgi:hypothetical protein